MTKQDYAYERCLLEIAPRLKQRGYENHEKLASNICRMRIEDVPEQLREFAIGGSSLDGTRRTFAMQIGDIENNDDYFEFPVIAITSGPHDADGDQKVYIEPSILKDNIEAFDELPVYFNHQRTPDDLLGVAINPEMVELDDGLQAVKLLARIHKNAEKANEVLEKIENGDMTHVSIDWLSRDLDVWGEPFATNIRPIEVSFIDNGTRTPVCDACTIGTKCERHETKDSCDCNSHGGACTCETNGSNSEEKNMTENTVEKTSDSETIVEREFASMKVKLSDMVTTYDELNKKHGEALSIIAKFEEVEEARKSEQIKARKSGFINSIITKETLLGKVNDETRDERETELSAWDDIKLEGFSIAMDGVAVPEEVERTFGKGKARDAEEKPVDESEKTHRMFAMEDGKIVFKGLETEEKGD